MKYFISFIEEGIFNPKYDGYIGGRVEVYCDGEENAIEEIRFFTKDVKGFSKIIERFDFKDISRKRLDRLRRKIKEKWQENIL